MTSTSSAALSDCVGSLRSSLAYLDSSVETIGDGVKDFPRMAKVLRMVRHFELIPQSTLQAAEASLRSELAPAIETLLDRADAHIDRIERRIESLKARSELQQGRLYDHTATTTTSKKPSSSARLGGNSKRLLDERAKARARALKQDREVLQYSIERLELQVLQKERELRKGLDAAAAAAGT